MKSFFFQIYAPTTLAPARDFWTLRYTTTLENGSFVVSTSFTLVCLRISNLATFVLSYEYFADSLLYVPSIPPPLKVCERSLSGTGAGPNAASASQFVRAQMLPSGYLIRPCDGGGSIIHIVDHLNLEVRLHAVLPLLFLISLFCLAAGLHCIILFFRHGVPLRFCVHFMNRQKLWHRK